jgi:hypothetical protein
MVSIDGQDDSLVILNGNQQLRTIHHNEIDRSQIRTTITFEDKLVEMLAFLSQGKD